MEAQNLKSKLTVRIYVYSRYFIIEQGPCSADVVVIICMTYIDLFQVALIVGG